MRAGADADRGIVQRAGIGLGIVDHVLEQFNRVWSPPSIFQAPFTSMIGSKLVTGWNAVVGDSVTLVPSVCAPKCSV